MTCGHVLIYFSGSSRPATCSGFLKLHLRPVSQRSCNSSDHRPSAQMPQACHRLCPQRFSLGNWPSLACHQKRRPNWLRRALGILRSFARLRAGCCLSLARHLQTKDASTAVDSTPSCRSSQCWLKSCTLFIHTDSQPCSKQLLGGIGTGSSGKRRSLSSA